MRYDVKKFLFIGVEKDRNAFFEKAQEAGVIHFINTKPIQNKAELEEVKIFSKAISILRGLPVVEQEESVDYDIGINLANHIVNTKNSLDKLYEDLRVIKLEISRVEAFGDFSLQDIESIENQTGRKIQFYCAKRGFAEKEEIPENVIYVTSDHGLDYFMAINSQPTQYPKMIEMEITRSWGDLKEQQEKISKEISHLERHLKGYAKYNRFLHHALVNELNEFHLAEAKETVDFPLEAEDLFAVEGWVPEHKVDAVNQVIKEMNVFSEEIDVNPEDIVPTYLENTGLSRIGEDLVHIYDTPSKTDKDPSLWVLVFFALFFSMIIGDGGYGLIFLLVAMYIRYKHSDLKGFKKRALNLLTILGFCCLVWGFLTTSFFGVTIAPDSPIRKVSLMSWLVEKKVAYHMEHHDDVYTKWVKDYPELESATSPNEFLMKTSEINKQGSVSYEGYSKFSDHIMMELALLVGVIHIIISMCRHISRNWAYVGWIILIIGTYLYAPSFLDATSIPNFVFGLDKEVAAKNGLYMIYGGFALAVILALFQHKWMGLLEATVAIQIFGDILSYLRLYALGLSGSLLTATMIDLAASVPLIFSILILCFGHAVNIVLGIMGGVIHGLRLNFLEWYHYSFEGGGKMFNPLRKEEIE
jgi:V/A-type H+-transporting ATPase subunit I